MNLETNSSRSLRWLLCGLELTLILVQLLLFALIDKDIDSTQKYFQQWMFKTLGFSIIFALWSLLLPLNRSLWKRRAYIVLELLLITYAGRMGFGFEVVTWFFIVKSCFLLNRKDVVFTVIVTGIAQSLTLAANITRNFPTTGLQSLRENCINLDKYYNLQQVIKQTILDRLAIYIAISTITVWICFLMIAERKSRQKAEALTQQVETLATALERTRIARDIHDSLGHSLTSLDVQLELAIKLHSRNPDQSLQALETAKLLAFQSVQNVRTSVQTMRKSDFDLKQALVALIEQIKQNQSFKMQLEMNLPQLPLQTSYQLYCVVQEGLTNIQKHSKASLINLRAQSTSETITLELVDNGIGFDILAPRSGFGLRGMQERVQSLGGKLIVNSSPGQGTQILATIPL